MFLQSQNVEARDTLRDTLRAIFSSSHPLATNYYSINQPRTDGSVTRDKYARPSEACMRGAQPNPLGHANKRTITSVFYVNNFVCKLNILTTSCWDGYDSKLHPWISRNLIDLRL